MATYGHSNHIFVNRRGYTRRYYQAMEKRTAISLKLPPDLLKAVDAYRNRQTYKPTRTQVIEEALKAVLDGEKLERKGGRK